MQTGIDIIGRDVCYISTDDQTVIRRLTKLSAENKGSVACIRPPETNDGCWYGTIPASWVRISPPRKLSITDEQRAASAERLRKMREKLHD